MLIRIRLPAKLPCHMHDLRLLSCSFLLNNFFLSICSDCPSRGKYGFTELFCIHRRRDLLMATSKGQSVCRPVYFKGKGIKVFFFIGVKATCYFFWINSRAPRQWPGAWRQPPLLPPWSWRQERKPILNFDSKCKISHRHVHTCMLRFWKGSDTKAFSLW